MGCGVRTTASLKRIVVLGTPGADFRFVGHAGIANMTAYSMSKAAAVMATTKWAVKLKDEGFVVVSLSPGLVDTTDTIGESGKYSSTLGPSRTHTVSSADCNRSHRRP